VGNSTRRGSKWRLLSLLCCVLLGALLLESGSAQAAGGEEHTAREHAFSFEFGGQGNAVGQFSHPAGVAVNDSTGNVYVADRENGRVEEFTTVLGTEGEPTGEKYSTSLPPIAFPTQIAVDNCSSECGKDPSNGDVYIAGAKNSKASPSEDDLLYKFSAAGLAIGLPHKFKGPITGLAVSSTGALYVYEQTGGAVGIFDNAELNLEAKKPEAAVAVPFGGGAQSGLAVDSKGDPYVAYGLTASEAGSDVALGRFESELASEYDFLHGGAQPVVGKLGGAGNISIPALDYEPTTAVAVPPVGGEAGNAFITNVTSVAGVSVSSLAIFGPEGSPEGGKVEELHGKLIQRLVAPGLEEADAVAVDPATGSVYVAGGASDTVDVFNLEPRARPTVSGLSAQFSCSQQVELCGSGASVMTMRAKVNSAGVDTQYQFEYGTGGGTCKASPSSCTVVPAPAGDAGGEFGGQSVSVEIPSPAPGAYHYRVTADAPGQVVHSAEKSITIVASLGSLPDGRAWEMVSPPNKNGAEPEAITREGGTIQAAANGDAITYVADGPMPAESEPEGNRSPEHPQILSTRRASAGWATQDIATPNGTGAGVAPGHVQEYRIFSPNLALSLVGPFPSDEGPLAVPPLSVAEKGETTETTIYLGAEPPLEPEASDSEESQYFKEALKNGTEMKNRGFLALVNQQNKPTTGGFGAEAVGSNNSILGLVTEGATPDLSHVVFESYKEPTGLYEWNGPEHPIQPVSRLAETGARVPAESAGLGGAQGEPQDANPRHAISNDGSLVFWTDKASGTEYHLDVRDTTTQETLQLDKLQKGEKAPESSTHDPADADFQTASADGSKVFFTDTQRLTANSKAVEGSPDLYVFELEAEGGAMSGKLVDLTAQAGADVLASKVSGGVLGASEDGSYIYFVADGALSPGASRGQCAPNELAETRRPVGSTCNLYVRHYDSATQTWEPTKLIAVLSSEDNPDWGGPSDEGELSDLTSRVSPNGQYVAFMSDRSLTGYDNEDLSSKAPGERRDEEVYLYDAATGHLVCASCNPTGARPRGVFDLGQKNGGGTGEGLGLVVDRRENWGVLRGTQTDNWLAGSIPGWDALGTNSGIYQSRYLSNSGRLFFNSADPLVPLARPTREEPVGPGEKLTVGVENVYEYEPAEVGSCTSEGGCVGLISSGTSPHESAFLDASENGNDVFLLTAAQLAPQDTDTNFDIYDASICGATCPSAPKAAPESCEAKGEEGCQTAFVPTASFGAPASGAAFGSGNISKIEVLGKKEEKPVAKKPPTRAQKLAVALKACKKDKKKGKRLACEKQARKKYGPIKKSAKKSSTQGSSK
jgi:DNA-binding beta-propeller fold protein YncE